VTDRPAVLAPSILSADFSKLGDEIRAVEAGGAGVIHIDAMDGHFVPNLTMGPIVAAAARRVTDLPLDCHLMVADPDRWIEPFADAGAETITVHVEAAVHLHRTLTRIREVGCKAGVALNPATPVAAIEPVLEIADLCLVMSVNPGFGGQRFIPSALDKLRTLRGLAEARGLDPILEIDGGVDATNLAEVVAAGAEWIVAGSAVYGSGDPEGAARDLTTRMAGARAGV